MRKSGTAPKAPVRAVTGGDVSRGATQKAVAKFTAGQAVDAAQVSKEVAVKDILSRQKNKTAALQAILKGSSADDVVAIEQMLLADGRISLKGKKSKLNPDETLSRDWRTGGYPYENLMSRKTYEAQKYALQVELLKLQAWAKESGQKIVLLFEGRDAAGKGGAIKRFMEHLNPRGARVVALEKPSEVERGQWYFQRYVQHLPTAGEIVLLDRSWYNRAGVERVMGFASDAEVDEFLWAVPQFEDMLIRSGIILVKYWFSISDEEQERRFQARIDSPLKRWKLSPMDIESRNRWEEYSHAKDEMLRVTDTVGSPWWVVDGEDKRSARLNCISHLLTQVEYRDVVPDPIELPPRPAPVRTYERPPIDEQTFVPQRY